jgi:hypothetical protein
MGCSIMRDAADDEEDETENRRRPDGKGRPGGVAAAIDALIIHISYASIIAGYNAPGFELKRPRSRSSFAHRLDD